MTRLYPSFLVSILLLSPSASFAASMKQISAGPVHISYPADWTLYNDPQGSWVHVSPPVPDTMVGHTFPAIVAIEVQRTSVQFTAAKFGTFFAVGAASTESQNFRPGFMLKDSADATMLGTPARRYEYNAEWASVHVRAVSIITALNGRIVIATIYAPPENFDQFLPAFNELVSSLTYSEVTTVRRGASKIPVIKKASRSSSVSKTVRKSLLKKTAVPVQAASSSSTR